ncbi:MAG: DUF1513 domain-containing protein [Ascidiaceihabitans sp.]|nr:DUF1513 domain-containing protein [Ascidiaceihabitans sp.]
MAVSNPSRRGFIAGLMATGLMPAATWADAGSPSYLSAAALPDGTFVLCGISATLEVLFQIPLPGRGHAAAAHPNRPEAVAFARRPGTFAIVFDCITHKSKAILTAPEGRHFYGHGTFSKDGDWLYTTENDYEAGQGRIGVWDVQADYARVAEFPSGGIGPHDIKRLPDSDTLVVANGGIDTHPDSGRTKLNIPTMRPNLSYLKDDRMVDVAELPASLHKNSIRHLAVSSVGHVAFGMQWQGDTNATGLVGVHQRGSNPAILSAPPDATRALQGYIGSIAVGSDNATIAVTSPRGGVVQTYDAKSGRFLRSFPSEDASGIAANTDGFITTSGLGILQRIDGSSTAHPQKLAWDNHLVSINSSHANIRG